MNCETYPINLDDGRVINIKQLSNGEESGIGTGAIVWPAAHVLSKILEMEYGQGGLLNRRVCDIGSGTGALGILAAALGATAYLTDLECIFFLMEENKRIVCSQNPSIDPNNVIVKLYDWGDTASAEALGPPFDILLVSDCVLPKLYPIEPLVQVAFILPRV